MSANILNYNNTKSPLLQVDKDGYGFELSRTQDPRYKDLGKVIFQLKVDHQDQDISVKFLKMIDIQLDNILSISTMDGEDEELLIIWGTNPRDQYIKDMNKCILGAWNFLTSFDCF